MEEKTEATQEKTEAAGCGHRTRQPGCFFCMTAIPLFQNCWSDMTKGHFRNSRIEFLKGIRSLIDDRISRLSRETQKGTHVTVE